jgi:hypothetical protein
VARFVHGGNPAVARAGGWPHRTATRLRPTDRPDRRCAAPRPSRANPIAATPGCCAAISGCSCLVASGPGFVASESVVDRTRLALALSVRGVAVQRGVASFRGGCPLRPVSLQRLRVTVVSCSASLARRGCAERALRPLRHLVACTSALRARSWAPPRAASRSTCRASTPKRSSPRCMPGGADDVRHRRTPALIHETTMAGAPRRLPAIACWGPLPIREAMSRPRAVPLAYVAVVGTVDGRSAFSCST